MSKKTPPVKPVKEEHFFLNFGGPGPNTQRGTGLMGALGLKFGPRRDDYTFDVEQAKKIQDECRKFYTGPVREVQFNVKDINVTVHTFGIHRALSMHLPENASLETQQAFEEAKKTAIRFTNSTYDPRSNNCVTAVSKTLNCLDPNSTPANMVWPWNLDTQLKKYCGNYAAQSMEGQFAAKYQEVINKEHFASFRTRHWTQNRIEAPEQLIKHAYTSGERTKSTLLELAWVREDKSGLLHPTDKAPAEFKTGLEAYNQDYEKVQQLKQLYEHHSGSLSLNRYNFFKDNPDYETALSRIKAQAAVNPTGASAQVMKAINETSAPQANNQSRFKESLQQIKSEGAQVKKITPEMEQNEQHTPRF